MATENIFLNKCNHDTGPDAMPDTGVYRKGLVETCELYVFALFPVTRHNTELVEAQLWTSRSITHHPAFTAHMHTKWEGGHDGEIFTPPLKIVEAMRHSP